MASLNDGLVSFLAKDWRVSAGLVLLVPGTLSGFEISALVWLFKMPDEACVAAMAFVGLEKLPLPGDILEKRDCLAAVKPMEKFAASDVFALMKRESLAPGFSISLF